MHLQPPMVTSRMMVPVFNMADSYISLGKTFIRTDRITIPSNSSIRYIGRLTDHDVHLLGWSFTGSRSGLTAELYENPEVISEGISTEPVNRNRVHPEYQTSIRTFVNPAIGNEGLLLYQTGFPGSGTGPSANVVLRSRDPMGWLLKRDNTYMWKLSNISNQSMEVYVEIDWAEL